MGPHKKKKALMWSIYTILRISNNKLELDAQRIHEWSLEPAKQILGGVPSVDTLTLKLVLKVDTLTLKLVYAEYL